MNFRKFTDFWIIPSLAGICFSIGYITTFRLSILSNGKFATNKEFQKSQNIASPDQKSQAKKLATQRDSTSSNESYKSISKKEENPIMSKVSGLQPSQSSITNTFFEDLFETLPEPK